MQDALFLFRMLYYASKFSILGSYVYQCPLHILIFYLKLVLKDALFYKASFHYPCLYIILVRVYVRVFFTCSRELIEYSSTSISTTELRAHVNQYIPVHRNPKYCTVSNKYAQHAQKHYGKGLPPHPWGKALKGTVTGIPANAFTININSTNENKLIKTQIFLERGKT